MEKQCLLGFAFDIEGDNWGWGIETLILGVGVGNSLFAFISRLCNDST